MLITLKNNGIINIMRELFKIYGIEISDIQLKKFEKFKDLLKEYNDKFNITSIRDDEGIIKKHFIDSLIGVDKFSTSSKVMEVGSGGGFPSIPLKIMRDDLSFCLLEATGKKCEFLKKVIEELELTDMKVINGRAEDYGKNLLFREKFDAVTARAVASMNTLCEYCLPFVKQGGVFVAYKGRAEEELREAENAIKILGGKLTEKSVYGNEEEGIRTIAVITKISATPIKYPRGNGKERSKPL